MTTKLYKDADYYESVIQRRKILSVFLSVTAVWLAAFAVTIAMYISLPYRDPNGGWIIAAACVLTAAYMIFSFPFMGIKFKRSNAYCKMLKFISLGLKEYAVLPFGEIDNWVVHDGVDVNVAVFYLKNVKKEEALKRQIFVDGEKDFPPFTEGGMVRIISQGNLLIEYEIL